MTKREKVNPRVKRMLLRLCRESSHLPTAELAREMELSAKTVLRELPEVAAYLERCGLRLEKKTGAGVRIAGGAQEKRELLRRLRASAEEEVYTPKQRLAAVIGKLLQKKEPVKLYEFTAELGVTESTVSSDLNKAEPWFREMGLRLVRKPGLGLYLEGEEAKLRSAMARYVYEHVGERAVLSALYDRLASPEAAVEASEKYLLRLVDVSVLRTLEQAVRAAEAAQGWTLSDRMFLGLLVHLALAVRRIGEGERIEMAPALLDELRQRTEFAAAERIAAQVEAAFGIAVSPDETGHIALHLLGSDALRLCRTDGAALDNFHLVSMVRRMLRIAEEETGIVLLQNEKLFTGLVHHLGPAISRLAMRLEIRNPLLAQMQERYPELLRVAEKCAAVPEAALGRALPASEVAYIAMHLGAALEEERRVQRRYRVAVACPTGLGTSRLLAARLRETYDALTVVELISALHLGTQELERLAVDFVVSTVPIPECGLPVVVVAPLLEAEDRARVASQIESLAKRVPVQKAQEMKREARVPFRKRLQRLNECAGAVEALLAHFFLVEDARVLSPQALVRFVASLVRRDAAGQEALAAALERRESFGKTALVKKRLLLLHCRDAAVPRLQCGVVRLRAPLLADGGQVAAALVLLAPQSAGALQLEAAGRIAAALVEARDFAWTLHNGGRAALEAALEEILEAFYLEKIRTVMEGTK